MKVVEIFNSIEGEGKRAGLPCTFIRLFGCNLNCKYCDSEYAWKEGAYKEMTVSAILETLANIGCRNATVTGGEPLIHDNIENLLMSLINSGYNVNVETNGTQKIPFRNHRIFYTMDYKTGASGMSNKMNMKAIQELSFEDVLKFVVGSEDDLKQASDILLNYPTEAEVYFSPVFGSIEAKDIVKFLLKHRMWNCKVQLQLHKYIWNPDMKGV